jgi:hypothetical protein
MWIAKGALLGLWLFGFGTLGLLYLRVFRHMGPNSAVGVSVITSQTTHSPLWWTALVVCLVLGLAVAHSWRGPLVVWIALAVTGLIPTGFLTVFIVLLWKTREAQGHL